MTETNLIQKIAKRFRNNRKNLKVGIGDDCSVITLGGKEFLVTCDSLVEDVHFKRGFGSWKDFGIKAAAAALSDIAAMGGTPKFAWTALSLPKNLKEKEIHQFYAGLKKVFENFSVLLAGGNITRSIKGFAATLMILGERWKGTKMLRSEAKVGDGVYISGPLGWAGVGLKLLDYGLWTMDYGPTARKCIRAFLRPKAQIKLGQWLAKNKIANACIDVSDGLLKDVNHIAYASKVQIIIEADKIPLSPSFKTLAKKLKENPLNLALTSGEDYCLAFSVPRAKEKFVVNKKGLKKIGCVQKGKPGLRIINAKGQTLRFSQFGYDALAPQVSDT